MENDLKRGELIYKRDAEDAIMKNLQEHAEDYVVDFKRGMAFAHSRLDSIPAVDAVEVRHGHWNKRVDNSGRFRYVEWYCTACRAKVQTGQPRFVGSYIEHEPAYKYCPYCGARMDGEVEHNAAD